VRASSSSSISSLLAVSLLPPDSLSKMPATAMALPDFGTLASSSAWAMHYVRRQTPKPQILDSGKMPGGMVLWILVVKRIHPFEHVSQIYIHMRSGWVYGPLLGCPLLNPKP